MGKQHEKSLNSLQTNEYFLSSIGELPRQIMRYQCIRIFWQIRINRGMSKAGGVHALLIKGRLVKSPFRQQLHSLQKEHLWNAVIQPFHSQVYMFFVSHELVRVFQKTRSHGMDLRICQCINLSLVSQDLLLVGLLFYSYWLICNEVLGSACTNWRSSRAHWQAHSPKSQSAECSFLPRPNSLIARVQRTGHRYPG